jgi:hypothetical protein
MFGQFTQSGFFWNVPRFDEDTICKSISEHLKTKDKNHSVRGLVYFRDAPISMSLVSMIQENVPSAGVVAIHDYCSRRILRVDYKQSQTFSHPTAIDNEIFCAKNLYHHMAILWNYMCHDL